MTTTATANPYRTEIARLAALGTSNTSRIAALATQAKMFDAWSVQFDHAIAIRNAR